MTPEEAKVLCRQKLQLRIGPAMSEYVAGHITGGERQAAIPVIGGDARTGIPARKELSAGDAPATQNT